MKNRQRCSAVLLLAVTLSTAMLTGCNSAGRSASPTIVGEWNVTYGNPVVVDVKLTRADAYSMTAKNRVTLTGGSPCQLPIGTTIATFSGSGASYTGQHGLWNTSNCSFAQWTTLRLALSGNTAIATFGTGGTLKLTRLSPVVATRKHPLLWLWLVLLALLISIITFLLLHRWRQDARSAT
jgi:hypothetical protein